MGPPIRRALSLVLFGAVAIMSFKALFTRGLSATEYLTAALAFATAVYGWFVSETVIEMQLARSAQLLPRIVPTLHIHGLEGRGWPRLLNVGPGTAFDLELQLSLTPGGDSWEWKHPAMAAGDTKDFSPKEDLASSDQSIRNTLLRLDKLTERYQFFTVEGSCINALGNRLRIRAKYDIRDYWRIRKAAAGFVYAGREDPNEGIVRALEQIHQDLSAISQKYTRQF